MKKSQALVLVLVLSMLILAPTAMAAPEDNREKGIIEKIIELFTGDNDPYWVEHSRSIYSITYKNANNPIEKMTKLAPVPINYYDNTTENYFSINKDWIDSQDANYDYEVTEGVYEAYMTEVGEIKVEVKGDWVSMEEVGVLSLNHGLMTSLKQRIKNGQFNEHSWNSVVRLLNKMTFETDNYQTTYTYHSDRLKSITKLYNSDGIKSNENLIIISKLDTNSQIYIDGNLWDKSTISTTNEITLISSNNNTYYIDKPFAYDSGDKTHSVEYVLLEANEEIYLLKVVDGDWLNSGLDYPVYVDPTTDITQGQYIIKGDVMTIDGEANQNGKEWMSVATDDNFGNGKARSYLWFNMSHIPLTHVKNASLFLNLTEENYNADYNLTATYCNNYFDEDTLTYQNQDTTVNNCESLGSIASDIDYSTTGEIEINLTTNVSNEAATGDLIFAVKLQMTPDDYSGTARPIATFSTSDASDDPPYVYIWYNVWYGRIFDYGDWSVYSPYWFQHSTGRMIGLYFENHDDYFRVASIDQTDNYEDWENYNNWTKSTLLYGDRYPLELIEDTNTNVWGIGAFALSDQSNAAYHMKSTDNGTTYSYTNYEFLCSGYLKQSRPAQQYRPISFVRVPNTENYYMYFWNGVYYTSTGGESTRYFVNFFNASAGAGSQWTDCLNIKSANTPQYGSLQWYTYTAEAIKYDVDNNIYVTVGHMNTSTGYESIRLMYSNDSHLGASSNWHDLGEIYTATSPNNYWATGFFQTSEGLFFNMRYVETPANQVDTYKCSSSDDCTDIDNWNLIVSGQLRMQLYATTYPDNITATNWFYHSGLADPMSENIFNGTNWARETPTDIGVPYFYVGGTYIDQYDNLVVGNAYNWDPQGGADSGNDAGFFVRQLDFTEPPTTPTSLTLDYEPIYAGETIYANASGSTDPEGEPVEYYYKFYNQDDTTTVQDWSITSTYTTNLTTDVNDTIVVYAKAYDGFVFGSVYSNSTYVYEGDAPTNPTNLDLSPDPIYSGMELTANASGSTDPENEAITYEYYFYNWNDSSILQGWSTDNTYLTTNDDASNWINVSARAWDGSQYSPGNITEDIFVNDGNWTITDVSYNDPVYELSNQDLNITINYPTAIISSVEADLIYNDYNFGYDNCDVTSGTSSDDVFCEKQITIPLTATDGADNQFYWNFTVEYVAGGNGTGESDTYNQTINYAFDINSIDADTDLFIGDPFEVTINTSKLTLDNYPEDIGVTINYDGTNYTASLDSSETTYELWKKSLNAASTSGNYDIKAYLFVEYSTPLGTNYTRTTSAVTQTVNNWEITTDCSGGKPITLHLDLLKEEEGTDLAGDMAVYLNATTNNLVYKTYNFSKSSSADFNICMDPSDAVFYVYGGIQYDDLGGSPSYVLENWYFVNATLTNETTNVSLYDLESLDSTSFEFTVLDTNFNPVTGVYLRLERFYPEENSYKSVEMAQSDSFGKGIFHLVTEDVFYRFFVFNESGTLVSTSPTKAICQVLPCELNTFIIGADPTNMIEPLDDIPNMEASLNYNPSTDIMRYEFNDLTGTATYGRLVLKRNLGTTTQTATIFDQQVNSSSGTIVANISTEDPGTIVAEGTVSRGGTIYTVINSVKNKLDTFDAGAGGLFWGLLIITLLSITMIGFNVKSAIIVLPVSLIAMSVLGFISFGQNTVMVLASVICMAALILFAAARR